MASGAFEYTRTSEGNALTLRIVGDSLHSLLVYPCPSRWYVRTRTLDQMRWVPARAIHRIMLAPQRSLFLSARMKLGTRNSTRTSIETYTGASMRPSNVRSASKKNMEAMSPPTYATMKSASKRGRTLTFALTELAVGLFCERQ